jgi:tetratricopeptide (TPR) repeat protein
MLYRKSLAVLLAALCASTALAAESSWRLTRSEHFEVYSQSDDAASRSILLEFEQLRAFFLEHAAFDLGQLPPVRVIAFGSEKEYEPYRLRSTSDAYFVGTEGRDYVVMAFPSASHSTIAAHEYAHLVLHASKAGLPPWLDEGLAEFYSTIRNGEHATEVGGDLPARSQTLRRRSWMPLAELVSLAVDSPVRQNRDGAELFYAQSWALTEMLLRSPEYAAGFQQVLSAARSGEPGLEALARVFAKSPDEITRDLRSWTGTRRVAPTELPAVELQNIQVKVSDVPLAVSRQLIADVLLAAGELDRAEELYRDLERETPQSADIAAALGTIALRRGDLAAARLKWKQAIDRGISDASLCYRYAVLAEQAGTPADEVRPALARAVALRPDFDDARYLLALLEKSSGNYTAAVSNLRAMKTVSQGRAYAYWIAMADALIELDAREEAKAAARQAEEHANTPSDREHAAQLAYIAETDFGVQFARDANGRTQMVTTRVPHQTANWNPFIETGDDLRRVQGTLREIDCSGDVTRFVVESAGGLLKLAIADPSRVQMRNAPSEFVCGPQEATSVMAEYAASATGEAQVRGMEFR